MGINDLPEEEVITVTELAKPQKQFETLVIPEDERTIDEILADYTADGWRIIHQNDVVAYNDDGHRVLHIVRLERTLGLKAITG